MQVFFTSPWVPAEWIKAHGLEPRGIWFAPQFAFDSLPLSAGLCAFAHAAVRLAEKERESAVIFTTHCDQLRRGFDAVASPALAPVFLFNLPATWQTPVGRQIFISELERLGDFLAGLGGHAPSCGELLETMTHYGLARERLRGAAAGCAGRRYAEAVSRFHWDGSCPPAGDPFFRSQEGPSPRGLVPVALIGGPLPRSQWDLLDIIERAGGRVVLNGTEAGERSLQPAFPLEALRAALAPGAPGTPPSRGARGRLEADEEVEGRQSAAIPPASKAGCKPALLEALTRAYIEGCVDVFQRPNTRLYAWLKERLAARGVRGIVLWHYVGCDLWRAEAQPLREAFGLPVLLLDADEAAGGSLRIVGRIEAFLEAVS
jgi:benzoyl-CoA reductase/2-hydroxyglutaryl-CoA dehydratase subunit BcrC/BadD/HgdB